jgi:hypothetical protein
MNIPGKSLFLIILMVLLFPAVYGQRSSGRQPQRFTATGCRPATEPDLKKVCGYFQPRSGSDLSPQPTTPCDPYEMDLYLRRRVVKIPVLPFPDDFKDRERSPSVSVTMLVDENGKVISATALSGPPALRESATSAARNIKFRPVTILGKRVKLSGWIYFRFAPKPIKRRK